MTRRTELLALAERVEREVANRVLDSAIWRIVNGWPVEDGSFIRGMWFRRDPGDSVAFESPPFFTTSIDAQATLPGRIVLSELEQWPDKFSARAYRDDRMGWNDGRAKTEPSARLAALLRAMAEDAA